MKKCCIPLSRPRRDTRHYRFPVPNTVWEYRLKPVEFMIFSYLCYHRSTSSVNPKAIAKGVHMAVGTVQKYLTVLVDSGLIGEDCTPVFKCEIGKFFTLPNEIFLLNPLPSAFLVYAYLLLIEDRRTHTCHPSYNTIAAETGISKNTALKSVGVLLEMQLITVEPSWYFDQHGMKWKGNNLYTILPVKIATEKFYRQQFQQMETDAERRRICSQQENYSHNKPIAALYAPVSDQVSLPHPTSRAANAHIQRCGGKAG